MAVASGDLGSSLSTLFSAHAKSAFRIGFSSPRRRSYRSSGDFLAVQWQGIAIFCIMTWATTDGEAMECGMTG